MPTWDKIKQLGKRLLIDTAQTNDETAGSQRFRQTVSEAQADPENATKIYGNAAKQRAIETAAAVAIPAAISNPQVAAHVAVPMLSGAILDQNAKRIGYEDYGDWAYNNLGISKLMRKSSDGAKNTVKTILNFTNPGYWIGPGWYKAAASGLKGMAYSADNALTIGRGLLSGKLKFGGPKTYKVWHQSSEPIETFAKYNGQRWDVTQRGADPRIVWFTDSQVPNAEGLMATRPYASQWTFDSQRPLIQTGELRGLLGRKNNTRNAIIKFGKNHGADAFEFRGIADNKLANTNVVAMDTKIDPTYLGGTGKIIYAGPTTGKSTFVKSGANNKFIDLDTIPEYKTLRKTIAEQLGLDFKDPAVTNSSEYQQAFNDFIRTWSQDVQNSGKYLLGSSKAILRSGLPLYGQPFIPDFETFVARNKARGFRETPEQLKAWYDSVLKSDPNIKINNSFIGEMPIKSIYTSPTVKPLQVELESPAMSSKRSLSIAERLGIPKGERSNPKSLEDPYYWGYQQWNQRYNKAVEAGNIEEAQRLRDLHFKIKAPNTKVIDKNGKPLQVYHFTGNPDIKHFDPTVHGRPSIIYFTSNPDGKLIYYPYDAAVKSKLNAYLNLETPAIEIYNYQQYPWQADYSKTFRISPLKKERADVLQKELRNIDSKVIDAWDEGNIPLYNKLVEKQKYIESNLFRSPYQTYSGTQADIFDLSLPSQKYLFGAMKESGADGLIHNVGQTQHYLSFKPQQIKLTNSITYDDGKIIPIVKRDNFHNPDIRYKQGGILKAQGGNIITLSPLHQAKWQAYKIVTDPNVWWKGGANLKDVAKNVLRSKPVMEDQNKAEFLFGVKRPETTDGQAYGWENDIKENGYKNVKSYEGTLNPYNEYVLNDRDKELVKELAKSGYTTSLNINDEYSDPKTEFIDPDTPYFDDVHGYRIKFHNDENGNPVISASDLYDFGKNYSQDFKDLNIERGGNGNLELQRKALNLVGQPYKLVQHNIPIRFTDNPQGSEIYRTNSFTHQVLDKLSDKDIAKITNSGLINPAIIRNKQGRILKHQQGGLLNLWQKAYDSKLGKGMRTLLLGKDNELSDEEYIQKHGIARPITGFAPLPTAPESGPFEGIEYLTNGHFGYNGVRYNAGLQNLSTAKAVSNIKNTTQFSKWERFLQKSLREQDDLVKYWNGERFSSMNQLKQYPKEFKKFQNWINGIKKHQVGGIVFNPYISKEQKEIKLTENEPEPYQPTIIYESAPESKEEKVTISQLPETTQEAVTTEPVKKKGQVVYKTNGMDIGNMQGVIDAFSNAGIDVRITSGVRPGSYTKQGKVSHHMTGWALDITPLDRSTQGFRNFLDQVRNSPELIKYLQDNKIGILRETNKSALGKTGGSAIHLHVGKDKSAVEDLARLLAQKTPYLGHDNSDDWYLGSFKKGGVLRRQFGGMAVAFTPYLQKEEKQTELIDEPDITPYQPTIVYKDKPVETEEIALPEEPIAEETVMPELTEKDIKVLNTDGTEDEKQVAAIKYLSQELQIRPDQAAGVVGIFTHESHFKLNSENKMEKRGENENVKANEYGIGINQWTHGRHHDYVNWITSHGNNSLKTQLDFAINEIKTKFPDFLNNLRNSENVQDATAYTWMQYTGAQYKNFTKDYMYNTLIPKKEATSAAWLQKHFGKVGTQGKLERRVKYANEALEKYLNSIK